MRLAPRVLRTGTAGTRAFCGWLSCLGLFGAFMLVLRAAPSNVETTNAVVVSPATSCYEPHPAIITPKATIMDRGVVCIGQALKKDDGSITEGDLVCRLDETRNKSASVETVPYLPEYRFDRVSKDDNGEPIEQILKVRARWNNEQWETHALNRFKANTIEASKFIRETVIYTFANYGVRDYAMNWIASLHMTNHTRFVILCYDMQMYAMLLEYGFDNQASMIPSHWVIHDELRDRRGQKDGLSKVQEMVDMQSFGSEGYKRLILCRHIVALHIWSALDVALLLSDVDALFLSPHVLDYIGSHHAVDGHTLVFQTDAGKYPNGGFYWATPVDFVKRYILETVQLALDADLIDQVAMMKTIQNQYGRDVFENIGFLAKALFPSGHSLKWMKLNHRLNIFPLVVHMNWARKEEYKRKQIKSAGLWFVGDQFAE